MVRIAYSDSKGMVSAVIKGFTWSQISHCGLILPDNSIIDSQLGKGGVTVRPFEDFVKEENRVIVKEYPWLSTDMYKIVLSQKGKPYDLTALFGIPFRRNWQDDAKWFCSELQLWASKKAGTPMLDKESWRTFPSDLFQVPGNVVWSN